MGVCEALLGEAGEAYRRLTEVRGDLCGLARGEAAWRRAVVGDGGGEADCDRGLDTECNVGVDMDVRELETFTGGEEDRDVGGDLSFLEFSCGEEIRRGGLWATLDTDPAACAAEAPDVAAWRSVGGAIAIAFAFARLAAIAAATELFFVPGVIGADDEDDTEPG